MKRNELVSKLSEKTGQTKILCETFINTLADVILEALMEKDNISFGTIGQFKYKQLSPRRCRMIKTGEVVNIPAKGNASFSLSKYAKIALSKIV